MNIIILKNFLLFSILLSYSSIIFYIIYKYNKNNTISNLICDKECKNDILSLFIIFGFFIILYEINKADIISLIIVLFLLFCIFKLINYKEYDYRHYIYTTIVFILIILFMLYNCFIFNRNLLLLSFIIQLIISLSILIFFYDLNKFLYLEILFILNFAFFYFLLH